MRRLGDRPGSCGEQHRGDRGRQGGRHNGTAVTDKPLQNRPSWLQRLLPCRCGDHFGAPWSPLFLRRLAWLRQ